MIITASISSVPVPCKGCLQDAVWPHLLSARALQFAGACRGLQDAECWPLPSKIVNSAVPVHARPLTMGTRTVLLLLLEGASDAAAAAAAILTAG